MIVSWQRTLSVISIINQSTSQLSINQPAVNRSVNTSTQQPALDESPHHSFSPPVCQSINQSIQLSINRSINQFPDQRAKCDLAIIAIRFCWCCTDIVINISHNGGEHLATDRSTNQQILGRSINQLINMSKRFNWSLNQHTPTAIQTPAVQLCQSAGWNLFCYWLYVWLIGWSMSWLDS